MSTTWRLFTAGTTFTTGGSNASADINYNIQPQARDTSGYSHYQAIKATYSTIPILRHHSHLSNIEQ